MQSEEIAVGRDILVIVFRGNLTAQYVEEIRAAFRSASSKAVLYVIADLEGVPFVDSSGLMELISGYKLLKECGSNFKLAVPVPQARLVLELTRADKFLDVYYDRREAINSVPRS